MLTAVQLRHLSLHPCRAAGEYDEAGLKALDYVIASASKHGVKLILSFIDNWKYYNGVDQFMDWCITERKMPPPKEIGGDTDTTVSCRLQGLEGWDSLV